MHWFLRYVGEQPAVVRGKVDKAAKRLKKTDRVHSHSNRRG